MKYLLISLIVLFSGCSGVYDITKGVYLTGKDVVILNADLLDENTTKKLEKVDNVTTRYDKTREAIIK
jgi:uncharacterized protein YceK